MIGPININFDIQKNAQDMYSKNNFTIDSFNINFDGAICNDGTSIVEGSDPANEKSIVCRFDRIKTYKLKSTYTGKNSA